MPLNDIVNVNITSQTTAIPEANFGIPLVLGTNKAWNDLARIYSNLSGVAADFAPTTPEYISAQAIFGQKNAPTNMWIGRRQADVATLNITTGMFNKLYTVTIDGFATSVNTNTLQQKSTITWSGNFTTGSPVQLIDVKANGETLGTVKSYITYSTDFNSNSVISTTVNNVTLTPPISWTTDSATTLAAVATQISGAAGVASATPGTDRIVVVFSAPGDNTVTSSVVSGSGSQPTTSIVEGGFQFNTNQATTIGAIATAFAGLSTVDTAIASGDTITVTSNTGAVTTIDSSTTYFGGGQPTATIVNDSISKTIAKALETAINANTDVNGTVTAAYVSSPDGTLTITSNDSGTPWSLSTTTNIIQPNKAIVEITNVLVNANYFVTINGDTYNFLTTNATATAEQIVQALVPQINDNTSLTGIVAVDNSDGTFTVTGNPVEFEQNEGFYIAVSANSMAIIKGINTLDLVPTDTIVTTLDDILNFTGNSWYALSCTDRTLATVLAICGWVQAQKLIFGTASSDANIIDQQVGVDTTSVAAQMQNLGFTRSFCMYHQDADTTYPECAWFGAVLPLTPGGETWKFKQLAGIAYSPLTTNQSNNALNKDCNTYEYIGGVGITQNGTMAVGEYIDIIRGIDWLSSTIQNYVYGTLVNSAKVPYTDAGITSIQAQIQRALQTGVDNNFLADNPAYTVTVPLAVNCSANDKANRILKNVTFTATLAGAIHAVQINGTVTV